MTRTEYAATLGAMFARAATGTKLGLTNMRAALALFGDPQKRVRHVVVAGTNGKGSTSTLIADALRHADHKVGHYTSPHLLRFTERIRVDGAEIESGRVVTLYAAIASAERRLPQPLSFFEVATLMGLLVFAEERVDIAVLEVGMGGRLDAVNVVDRMLSVITPIGIDHERHLGSTLSAIASEKAGIIQRDVPVVSAPQDPVVWDVLEAQARMLDAPLFRAPPFPSTSPPGTYQRTNVATAAASLQMLRRAGLGVGVDHLTRACREFRWPGRYQWLGDILLDGAHNGHGVDALLTALDNDEQARGRPMHLVATVLADKDPAMILGPLAKRTASIQLVPVGSARSRSLADLEGLGHPVVGGIAQALVEASRRAGRDAGFVLVTGSLLLVADALAVMTGALRDPPIDW